MVVACLFLASVAAAEHLYFIPEQLIGLGAITGDLALIYHLAPSAYPAHPLFMGDCGKGGVVKGHKPSLLAIRLAGRPVTRSSSAAKASR